MESASKLAATAAFIGVFVSSVWANEPPVADAGPDRYIDNAPAFIDGTGSYDPDPGDSLTFEWSQFSGPAVVLTDTDTATPSVTAS